MDHVCSVCFLLRFSFLPMLLMVCIQSVLFNSHLLSCQGYIFQHEMQKNIKRIHWDLFFHASDIFGVSSSLPEMRKKVSEQK